MRNITRAWAAISALYAGIASLDAYKAAQAYQEGNGRWWIWLVIAGAWCLTVPIIVLHAYGNGRLDGEIDTWQRVRDILDGTNP